MMKTKQTTMKLAELLALRADKQKRITLLLERAEHYAVVRAGTEPAEDSQSLVNEALGEIRELHRLVASIHATNAQYRLADGRTLTEAIAEKDALTQKHKLLSKLLTACSESHFDSRFSTTERTVVLDLKKLRKQLDDLAVSIRRINLQIQEANWLCEVSC